MKTNNQCDARLCCYSFASAFYIIILHWYIWSVPRLLYKNLSHSAFEHQGNNSSTVHLSMVTKRCVKKATWKKNFFKKLVLKKKKKNHFVLVMTLLVRFTKARLEIRAPSSSVSGRASIAFTARVACSWANSLVFWIPWLFPR